MCEIQVTIWNGMSQINKKCNIKVHCVGGGGVEL